MTSGVSPLSSRHISRHISNPFLSPELPEERPEERPEGRSEGRPEEIEENRPPSRANEAPEWIPPEVRHNGESGWIHTIPGAGASEKVAMTSLATPTAETEGEGEPVTPKKRKWCCGVKLSIIITVLVAALIIGAGWGLGLGLGGALHNNQQSSSSSPSSAATMVDGRPLPTTTGSVTATPTFSLPSLTSAPNPASITVPASQSVPISFNNKIATVGIASVQGGSAISTITVASFSEPAAGSVQTVGVFHSSAFDPAGYASTITYTAARPGATQGIGMIDCPQSNNAQYIASGGAVFQKLCYADIADSPNLGAVTVSSLDECIEACIQDISQSTTLGGLQCQSVSYSANITLAFSQQNANCWFKSSTGYPSAGDWQQSTATFIGWLVEK